MKILAIETSGSTFSVALAEDNVLLSEVFLNNGLKHSEKLIPLIDFLLKETELTIRDIDKIAVSLGPGSFTGIRVGLSCAKTIAQNVNIKTVGMTSLEILEKGVLKGDYKIYPVIDALRDEVYVKTSKSPFVKIKSLESVYKYIESSKSKIVLAGNALNSCLKDVNKKFKGKVLETPYLLNFPKASVLALSAFKKEGLDYKTLEPAYVRRSWAEETHKK